LTCFFSENRYILGIFKIKHKKKEETAVMSQILAIPIWIRIEGKLLPITDAFFVQKNQKLPIQRGEVLIEAAPTEPPKNFPPGVLKSLELMVGRERITPGLIFAGPKILDQLQAMKDERLIDYELRDNCFVLSRHVPQPAG